MRRDEGGSEYPPLALEMEEVVFNEIRVYILKMQDTVAQYIAKRHIMYLCKRLVQRPTAWVYQRWWEKEGIDLPGERKGATAADYGEGGGGAKRGGEGGDNKQELKAGDIM